jgi:hypothetical protein
MQTKQTKKQWLLEKLQVSAAALTISTVFVLAPVNAEAIKSDAAPQKQTIANRIAHIREQLKNRKEHSDQTPKQTPADEDITHIQWRNWPNWPNWRNWGNWPNFWRNW